MCPCLRMRKKDLVLAKSKEQEHCKPLTWSVLCQGPVAAHFFHSSSLLFTLLFVPPPQSFSPQ